MDSLITGLHAWKETGEPEILHRIRVDIKKIKAIQRAVGAAVKSYNARRQFKPFREIFRGASQIRTPNVMSQLLQHYHIQGTPGNQPDQIAKAADDFRAHIPGWIRKIKKSHKKTGKSLQAVRRNDLKKFVQTRRTEIRKLLFPIPRFDTIHGTRKLIKEVVFLSAVLEEDGKFVRKLRALEEKAGQYHDKKVLIGLLTDTAGAETTQIHFLESECDQDETWITEMAGKIYK